MVANPEQDFVLKTVESRDVHFVRFWFTDVLGNMKSFAVVPGELDVYKRQEHFLVNGPDIDPETCTRDKFSGRNRFLL